MIRRYLFVIAILFVLGATVTRAQEGCAAIDTVYSFVPGTGQNSGQAAKYFPANILGMPSRDGREYTPVVTPDQICSIGLGGVIVVGFKNSVLLDRDGPDFTIFENAFRHASLDRVYAEPAIVSVSRDGVTFVPFPFDSLTLAGCAGVTPVYGEIDPCLAPLGGGDSFDLAAVGMDSVRYIRIQDVTSIVKDNIAHPFWDPTLSGFDLDAVLGLHVVSLGPVAAEPVVTLTGRVLSVVLPDVGGAVVTVYALDGRQLGESVPLTARRADITLPPLSRGAWLVHISHNNHSYSKVVFYE